MNNALVATGARTGLAEWIVQRVTAVYLAVFVLYLLATLRPADVATYVAWKQWIQQGSVRLLVAGALLSLGLHGWIGVRSVILDYVKPVWIRFLIQSALAVGLVLCSFWGAHMLMVDAVQP